MTPRERKAFQKRLGHRFRRRELLERALTHPSHRHEGGGGDGDNQRLEFLGDAVIGLLTAEYLYRLPDRPEEGEMTQYRSLVASRTGLAGVGRDWEVGSLLRLGRGEAHSGGARRDSNLADAVEAVVGAVYEDAGIRACRKLFERHFAPRLREHLAEREEPLRRDNPKGALQELTQRHWQESPVYRIVEERGPAHEREYVAAVIWHGEELARGEGSGKRAAEARAAARAVPVIQRRVARSSSTEGTSS